MLGVDAWELQEHPCFFEKDVYYNDETNCYVAVDVGTSLSLVPDEPNSSQSDRSLIGHDQLGGHLDELLIAQVQRRPVLYDHVNIRYEHRGKNLRIEKWEEIMAYFGDKYSVEELQKKWKYLRDNYVKAKAAATKYKPSGSGGGSQVKPSFRHYEAMTFLDDVLNVKNTVSNISVVHRRPAASSPIAVIPMSPVIASTSACSPLSSTDASRIRFPKKHKSTSRQLYDDVGDDILKEMQRPFVLPAPTEMHEVDAFCTRLSASLKRLDARSRAELEIDIMRLVFDKEFNN